MKRAPLSMALAIFAMACGQPEPTQIVLVIDTDIPTPDPLATIHVDVASPRTAAETFDLQLNDPRTPERPLSVTLYPRGGDVDTDVLVRVRGLNVTGGIVVQRDVQTRFLAGSSRMLRVLLADHCTGVVCPDDETCDESGCRGVVIAASDLPHFPGAPPILEGEACTPEEEVCNDFDDDCDDSTDEEIDIRTDAANCGRCGHACPAGSECANAYCTGQRPVEVALGGAHACIRRENGALACWGWNELGQVGLSTPSIRRAVTDVPGLAGVTQIACGGTFTCVLVGDQTRCFGGGRNGELGDGAGDDKVAPTMPLDLGSVRHLGAGSAHACAARSDGTVQCWGRNESGQLGIPPSPLSLGPVQVLGVANATQIAAGLTHTCALIADGSIMCWGANADGQLGRGDLMVQPAARPVTGLAGPATAIAAGRLHTCAVVDGLAFCWGSNRFNQLGNPGLSNQPSPVRVGDWSAVTLISAASSGSHTCVVRRDGVVSCWGSNASGQLGDATNLSTTPVDVFGISGITAIATGGFENDAGLGFSCAIDDLFRVQCWGLSTLGRLGYIEAANPSVPLTVPGLP